MNVELRHAKQKDFKDIEFLTREAFWNLYKPGCDEHMVVHKLHQRGDYPKELEMVAVSGGKIIGHIIYTICHVSGCETPFVSFGPVCVEPSLQKQGIGGKLIRTTLDIAAETYGAVFITGNPDYYHRFGFVSASEYGIRLEGIPAEDEAPFFMVKILREGALNGVKGMLSIDRDYYVKQDEVDIFDKQFPPKIKERRAGQIF